MVSTTAGNENSTIIANQKILNQYTIASQLSQSTIEGLNNRITMNKAAIYASQQQRVILSEETTNYISSISKYTNIIQGQKEFIQQGTSTIQNYSLQISTGYSSIAYNTSTFNSSAIAYSTAYYTYLGWNSLVDSQTVTLSAQKDKVSNLVIAQRAASKNLAESNTILQKKSSDLSTLTSRALNLQSILTKQRIVEATAMANYNSTANTLSTLSSTYNAAVANNKYAIALSTQNTLENAYTAALASFTRADILYNNASGPQGILLQARSMALSALQTAEVNKGEAASTTSTLKSIAGIANNDLYTTMLSGLQQNLTNNLRLANTFMNYKLSSLDAVVKWSTVYEASKIDIMNYKSQLTLYSSFYESSIQGGSTLLGLAQQNQSTVTGKNAQANAVNATISILNTNYDKYMSTYNGYITVSSMYNKEFIEYTNNISTVSSQYYSTNMAVNTLNIEYNNMVVENLTNAAMLFAKSSILNTQKITLATYDTQIKNNVNALEITGYNYKETFTRAKAIVIQNEYQGKVLQAIEYASTLTREQNLTTPLAADLTTFGIPETYKTLDSINTFLNNFTKVYDAYNNQATTIAGLSTSISYQANSWSTLNIYNSAYFYKTSTDPTLINKVNAASEDFSMKQDTVSDLLKTYNSGQNKIKIVKENFSTAYSSIFTAADIIGHESTISSFIISGYKQGLANLADNGIIFNL